MKMMLPTYLVMIAAIAWAASPGTASTRTDTVPQMRLIPISASLPPVLQMQSVQHTSWRPSTVAVYFPKNG